LFKRFLKNVLFNIILFYIVVKLFLFGRCNDLLFVFFLQILFETNIKINYNTQIMSVNGLLLQNIANSTSTITRNIAIGYNKYTFDIT
jgi:uncharacterized membrane protein